MDEFEILEELKKNYQLDLDEFAKLKKKLDPKSKKSAIEIRAHLALANTELRNLKNNLATKFYQREMSLKKDLKTSQDKFASLKTETTMLQKKIGTLENELKSFKEKEKAPKKPKTKVDPKLLIKFKKREADLKNQIKTEIEKWKKLGSDFEKVSGMPFTFFVCPLFSNTAGSGKQFHPRDRGLWELG